MVLPSTAIHCRCNSTYRLRYWNKISDTTFREDKLLQQYLPFTVLKLWYHSWNHIWIWSRLQQYLPFTVLKHTYAQSSKCTFVKLQQYLPFTVLKHTIHSLHRCLTKVATVLTVYGIETIIYSINTIRISSDSCNSTYRLRYWNLPLNLADISPALVATVLTVYGIET